MTGIPDRTPSSPDSRPSTQDRNFPQKTEGKIQRSLCIDKADHAIRLTQTGVQQAELAGAFLAERLAAEAAINQKAGVFDGLDDSQFMEPHLDACKDHDKHVLYNGRAYATTPMGESRLDVAIRCKHVFGTIVDDYRTHDIRHVIAWRDGASLHHGLDALLARMARYRAESRQLLDSAYPPFVYRDLWVLINNPFYAPKPLESLPEQLCMIWQWLDSSLLPKEHL